MNSSMVSGIEWHLDRLGYTGYTVAECDRGKVRIAGNGLDCVRYDMDVLLALRHLSDDEIPPDLGMVLEHCLYGC